MDFGNRARLYELEYEQRKRNEMIEAELSELRRRIERLERAESFNKPLTVRPGRVTGLG